MGLGQINLAGFDKVQVAIERLRSFEPAEGYYLAFSGGKDSITIYNLAIEAGVKFDAHYSVSPIDPPEIYAFIKECYPQVAWDIHARNFWGRFLSEGPPMRYMRWCCEFIKEAGGIGRVKVIGVRWAESVRRKSRRLFEACFNRPGTFFLSPILDWSDREVWEYIRGRGLPYCSLYDKGFTRLGCVLCPFEAPKTTQQNLVLFPKIVGNWRRAFERYYNVRIARGTPLSFESSEVYWQWWLSRKRKVSEAV